MPSSFHQRCQLALTHPVTLGAVALLLVNDWLLKPLWQSDWTTGKLSDFAWMVFAPPLLLFALSLMARNNAKATRTAFLAACAGQKAKEDRWGHLRRSQKCLNLKS